MAKAKILIIRFREELDLDFYLKLIYIKNFIREGLRISRYIISFKAKYINLFIY